MANLFQNGAVGELELDSFKGLYDIAVDPSGKFIYILELGNNHRMQKFTSKVQ